MIIIRVVKGPISSNVILIPLQVGYYFRTTQNPKLGQFILLGSVHFLPINMLKNGFIQP